MLIVMLVKVVEHNVESKDSVDDEMVDHKYEFNSNEDDEYHNVLINGSFVGQ